MSNSPSDYYRLDDVESKLKDTEREAERARKESKDARDHFTDVKRRRYIHIFPFLPVQSSDWLDCLLTEPNSSTKRTTTSPSVSTKFTRT